MLKTLLAAILLLCLTPLADATVYWASPSGNNAATCANIDSANATTDPLSYGTIGAAARCATSAGDVINIKGTLGTYTGFNHRIKTDDTTICGASLTCLHSGSSESVRTIIQGVPGEPTPQINVEAWITIAGQTNASAHRQYITIQNLNVAGSGSATSGVCILEVEGQFITIDNLTLTNPSDHHICAFRGSLSIDHLTIRNSRFSGQAGDGNGYAAYLNANDVIFEGNTVTNTRGEATVQVIQSGAGQSDRPIIRSNYIEFFNVSTQANHFGCGGIAVDGIDAQVYNNILVSGPACTNGAINHGYSAIGPIRLIAVNNVIFGGAIGIQYGLFATTSGDIILNNHIVGTSTPIINQGGSSGATVSNNRTTGAITDCTVSTTDYHLKSGSNPCVDAGTTVATVTIDYGGARRPQGSAYDIGPYEQQSGVLLAAPQNLKVQ